MIRWLSISGLLLALAWLGSALGCSGYEPQGQFWPANSGPLADGGASPSVLGGGPNQNETAGGAGNNGNANDNGNSGGNAGSGMQATGGGNSVGGGNPGAGGNSFAGSSSASGGNSTSGVGAQNCSLSVTVTTTAPGGQYQPRNVGAIWIADSSGRFVKSLEVWGAKRISRVVAWNAATKSAGVPGSKVDAITSATLSAHRTHNVSWNCRDYNEQVVPDGSYRVYFEVADSNSGGPNIFEPFNKGPSPSTGSASMGNFNNIVLTFTP